MAGELPRVGGPGAALTRVAARLTTPLAYLGVLGGLQVLMLWSFRGYYGIWLPLAAAAGFIALFGLVAHATVRWRLRLLGVSFLGALTTIGPTLFGIIQRPRIGLTMEHDGLLQLESAIDRLLKGQPIYGVDWSNTPMASLRWDLPGGNPALHHLAYYPLTVLVGVPFRLLAEAVGVPFDYRVVLISFALVGLGAVAALPIPPAGRFMMITAIFVSPLITLYLWSGRNDIEFIAVVMLSLTLLSRGHPTLAAAALGMAVALKPFAWVAVPFLLLVLYLRWRHHRSTREVLVSFGLLGLVPAATILPFFFANPRAFWADTVLYVSGGVADAYPIGGYGFSALLYARHVIAHQSDGFPFVLLQIAAMVPVLWIGARAFLRRPTTSRWMAGYAGLLLAFTFFARFFNDNYAGDVITLWLCTRPLGDVRLAPVTAEPADRLAA